MRTDEINFKYALKRIGVYAFITLLLVLTFVMCMNYVNVEVLIKDSFLKRAAVIIEGDDASTLTQVFSKSFFESDERIYSSDYDDYDITGFGYEMKVPLTLVFAFQSRLVITVTERVYYIDGSLKSEAADSGKSSMPPEWQDAKYRLTLVKSGGSWWITDIKTVKLLDKENLFVTQTPQTTKWTISFPLKIRIF